MSSHQEPSGYNSNEQPRQDLPPGVPQTDASWGYQQGTINAQQQPSPQYPQHMNFGQYMQMQPQQQYYVNQQPYYVNQQPYNIPTQAVQPFNQQQPQYYQEPSQYQAPYQPQHPQQHQANAPVQKPIVEMATAATQTGVTLRPTFGDSQAEIVKEIRRQEVSLAEVPSARTPETRPLTQEAIIASSSELQNAQGTSMQTEKRKQQKTERPVFRTQSDELRALRELAKTDPHMGMDFLHWDMYIERNLTPPFELFNIVQNIKTIRREDELSEKRRLAKQQKESTADSANWRKPRVASADNFKKPNWRSGNRSEQPPRDTQNREGTEFSSKKPVAGDQTVSGTTKPETSRKTTEEQRFSSKEPHPVAEKALTFGESQELPIEKPTLQIERETTEGKSLELALKKQTSEAEEPWIVGENQRLPTQKSSPEPKKSTTAEQPSAVLKAISEEALIEEMSLDAEQVSTVSKSQDLDTENPTSDFTFEYTTPSVQKNEPEKTGFEVPEDSPMSAELASNECEEKVSHLSMGESNKESQDVIPLPNDSPVVETLTQSASMQPSTGITVNAASNTQLPLFKRSDYSNHREEVTVKMPSKPTGKQEQSEKQGQFDTAADPTDTSGTVPSERVIVLSKEKDTRSTTKSGLSVDSEGWTMVGKGTTSSTELLKQPVKAIKPPVRTAAVEKETAEVEKEKSEVASSSTSPIKRKQDMKKQLEVEKEAKTRALEAENDLALSQAYAQTANRRAAKDTIRKTLQDFIGRQENVRVTLESSSPRSSTLIVPWFERDSILYAKRHKKPRNAADLVRTFLAARLKFWEETNDVEERVNDLQVMLYELLLECESDVIEEDVLYLKELFKAFPSYTEFFESEFLQMIFVTERVSKNTIPSISIFRTTENNQVLSLEEADSLSQYLERHAQRRYSTASSEWKPEKLELSLIIEYKKNPWDGFSMIDARAYFRARSAGYASMPHPTLDHLQLARFLNLLASVPSPVLGWDAYFMTQAEKDPREHTVSEYRHLFDVEYFGKCFNYKWFSTPKFRVSNQSV